MELDDATPLVTPRVIHLSVPPEPGRSAVMFQRLPWSTRNVPPEPGSDTSTMIPFE
ncbi:MAG: hypothetical protein JRN21_05555 [Nitrososphaerota archaeon]|nr:hypothetical protein [Nitrososphaerota archaeon]